MHLTLFGNAECLFKKKPDEQCLVLILRPVTISDQAAADLFYS